MKHPEEQEFTNFLREQKKMAIKKVIFWTFVLIAITFLVMFGIFSLFGVVAQSATGIL